MHNFKSTDSTIDKDPKLTLQVSSPRGFASEVGLPLRKPLEGELSHHRWLKIKNPAAPAVKHEAEEDWSTRQKTIARGRAVTPARRVQTKGGRSRPNFETPTVFVETVELSLLSTVDSE